MKQQGIIFAEKGKCCHKSSVKKLFVSYMDCVVMQGSTDLKNYLLTKTDFVQYEVKLFVWEQRIDLFSGKNYSVADSGSLTTTFTNFRKTSTKFYLQVNNLVVWCDYANERTDLWTCNRTKHIQTRILY